MRVLKESANPNKREENDRTNIGMNELDDIDDADKTNKREMLEMLQCKPEQPTTSTNR